MTEQLFSTMAVVTGPSNWMLMLLLKATLILVAALGITLLMQQRFSAGARHVVWLVTVAGVLVVPALMAWAPLPIRVLPAAAAATPQASVSPASPAASLSTRPNESVLTGRRVPGSENLSSPATATPAESRLQDMSPITLLTIVWAAVLLAIVGSLGFAALSVRRIVRRSQPLDSPDWLAPLWEVSDRLGLEEPPRVLRSEDAKMPFACGVLKPTIVLPAECDGWTLDRRRAVLLHELAHVKRHDLVGHTLGRVACAIYWFHPLVWTAAKNLRSESERACDDLALSCGARATDYAEHLLDIVTSVRGDATPSVALAMARRKEFEGRMLAILDPELRHSTPSRRQSFALIASLAFLAVVIGAAAPAPRMAQAAGVDGEGFIASRSDTTDSEPVDDVVIRDLDKSRAPRIGAPDDVSDANDASDAADAADAWDAADAADVSGTIASAIAAGSAKARATGVSADSKAGTRVGRDALMQMLSLGGSQPAQSSDERPRLLARVLSSDPSAELREIAAWGLREYADQPVAADALAAALRRDATVDVREMAAWALHDSDRSGPAFDALVAALKGDASEKVRAISAWSLGNIGSEAATEPLASALSDASFGVKRRAVWALGQIEPKQAPRALLAMLSDPDPRMRELVAWTLFRIEDPGAIPALEAALRRESVKELQVAYIRALAAVGEQSVAALRGLLESSDPEIKKIAVRALAGGGANGPWPWPWPEPRPFPR